MGQDDSTLGGDLDVIGCASAVIGVIAWYCGNASSTQPVATRAANAWGLFDALGNVWEKGYDWYELHSEEVVDPSGSDTEAERVIRGGSWRGVAQDQRAAFRQWKSFADFSSIDIGFHVARSLEP